MTLNPSDLVQNGGLILIGLIIFAEVALFLGFFLPGDTLLIAAGVYAAAGKISIVSVIIVAIVAAIVGDSTSYYIGRKLGPRVFKNENSILFQPSHVLKAEVFFKKHGAKTLLISHFVPVVRTFAPLLAGVAKMPYRRFALFNITGDIFWATSVTLVGYYIGSKIPNIDHYILLLVLFAVVTTASPTLYHIAKLHFKNRKK